MLTKRQKELYDFIDDYLREHGYAPTLDEIGARFGLASLATVHKHLSNLEKRGVIRRRSNLSRAIELVSPHDTVAAVELPLLGYVAAGHPIEAVEGNDTYAVPEQFIRKNNTYVLRVKGNSMIDDGIWDGDYIVVEHRDTADNGETVVALLDGSATVKRFYRDKGNRVRLQPANDTMAPIFARAKDVEIRGVVVAVMRQYR